MRGKENRKENEEQKKETETSQEKLVTSNRFETKSPVKSQSESAAVVAQLQTMRQGLERRKKLLKEEDLDTEEWGDFDG